MSANGLPVGQGDKVKSIGILGGAGPAAAAHIHQLLITGAQQAYGACQDASYPEIFVSSRSFPGMNERGYDRNDVGAISHQLVAQIRDLEAIGAQIILPACNTIDALHPLVAEVVGVPVIRLPEVVVDEAAARGHRTVAVLCSVTARAHYRRICLSRGLSFSSIGTAQQTLVTDAIVAVMGGRLGAGTRLLGQVVAQLRDSQPSASAIILGCTELSLIAPVYVPGADILDSSTEAVLRTLSVAYASADSHAVRKAA
jgi:aspartate racemase